MRGSVRGYAWLAVAAAVATITLKLGAYLTTGSVAILSDALESLVNLVTSIIALIVLTIAARPADEEHAYGHTKAEYFASGFEGAFILLAAGSIATTSVMRLINPVPLDAVATGLAVTAIATLINFMVARSLSGAADRFRSIALESGARHLMVDVWTSVGVVLGVGVADVTGWVRLDPLIALAVAVNIVRTGFQLIRRSLLGLLDTSLPEDVRQEIIKLVEERCGEGVQYHALRTRQAGAWAFISLHVLVPGEWSVKRGHDLLEDLEERIRETVPNCTVFTHLEPVEDPLSWQDTGLSREGRR
jgi:cation diffusion facilitator family transporter